MIKKYFYNDKFYKNIIKRLKKTHVLLGEYKKILKYKKMIKFVFQDKPLGTGDAVFKTKKFIKDKYFLMLLPDDFFVYCFERCCYRLSIIANRHSNSF